LSIWRRFPQISSPAKTVTPVTVPPGRAKLVAKSRLDRVAADPNDWQ